MKWGFFAGLGIGTAIGLVFAPKAGADLREDITDYARTSLNREKFDQVVEQGRERLEQVMDRGREQAQRMRDRVEPVVTQAKEAVSDLQDKVSKGGLMSILNEWSFEKLIEIDGIGPVLASKVIENRPYESEQQLIDSRELPPSAIESLRRAA